MVLAAFGLFYFLKEFQTNYDPPVLSGRPDLELNLLW